MTRSTMGSSRRTNQNELRTLEILYQTVKTSQEKQWTTGKDATLPLRLKQHYIMSVRRETNSKRKLRTIKEIPLLTKTSGRDSRGSQRLDSIRRSSTAQERRGSFHPCVGRKASIKQQTADHEGNRKPLDPCDRSPHKALAQRRDSLCGSSLLPDVSRPSAQARNRHQHGPLSEHEEDTSDVKTTLTPKDPPMTMREKFVMAARVVRRLCQVSLCMRKYAEDHLGKAFEFVSKPRYRVATKEGEAGGDQELTFDPEFFKMDSEYMFPEPAKRVAEKRPDDRTPADLRLIGAALRSLSSFRKYPRKTQDMLCRVVRYQSLGVNRVVIKKGHPGTAFYMVFSGRVGVVTTDDPDELMQRASMVMLRKGDIFGEMSLITGEARTATIKTQEQAELIVVDVHNLHNTDLHDILKQDFKYKFDFFRQLELFSPWDDEAMLHLASLARTEECVHGKVVVRDMAEEPVTVFVVKGMCAVVKLLDLSDASKQMEQNVAKHSPVSPSQRGTTSATTTGLKPLEERPSPAAFPPLRPQTVPQNQERHRRWKNEE
ncbi:uncharacterized protein LOC118403491 [Branchiostoma floridae]|uniref:Uncharacterized protein LOC118403491 n=1 Tax=Branchiostoma floridae TaxID=7739 RepID=A0A9J7HHH4_BRAFL|nr:uncharacterized protein LOC118403491 [Branchiostoma floridae]